MFKRVRKLRRSIKRRTVKHSVKKRRGELNNILGHPAATMPPEKKLNVAAPLRHFPRRIQAIWDRHNKGK